MLAEDDTHPVVISNVSASATDATLREFFSFCGPVGAIDLIADGDQQRGTVYFLSAAASETAVLLDLALIAGQPIHIRAVTEVAAAEVAELLPNSVQPPQQPPLPSPVPRHEFERGEEPAAHASSGTSRASSASASAQLDVITRLLQAGYTLGEQALALFHAGAAAVGETDVGKRAAELVSDGREYLRQVDETHEISAHVADLSAELSAKARAFDEEHEVSERAAALWSSAVETAASAVETAKPFAGAAAEAAATAATDLHSRAAADPSVGPALERARGLAEQGWAGVSAWASSLWEARAGASPVPVASNRRAATAGAQYADDEGL